MEKKSSPVQFSFQIYSSWREKNVLLKIYIKIYGSDISSPLSQEKETWSWIHRCERPSNSLLLPSGWVWQEQKVSFHLSGKRNALVPAASVPKLLERHSTLTFLPWWRSRWRWWRAPSARRSSTSCKGCGLLSWSPLTTRGYLNTHTHKCVKYTFFFLILKH